jgi:spore cortex formation protein SpoVR/YcgB (stage V sporulation)
VALLLEVAETAEVEPRLSKDRISGERVGWLLDAARALEAFLHPRMRSPSDEACGKRLERSKTRLKQEHRQNPSLA